MYWFFEKYKSSTCSLRKKKSNNVEIYNVKSEIPSLLTTSHHFTPQGNGLWQCSIPDLSMCTCKYIETQAWTDLCIVQKMGPHYSDVLLLLCLFNSISGPPSYQPVSLTQPGFTSCREIHGMAAPLFSSLSPGDEYLSCYKFSFFQIT